jgi:hypothetical protein
MRRVADHLVDHLAELEARLVGWTTEPDAWHGSMVTTPGDLAAFTVMTWTRPAADYGASP